MTAFHAGLILGAVIGLFVGEGLSLAIGYLARRASVRNGGGA